MSQASNRQDNSQFREPKVETGDNSNVGVASDFEAKDNSTVNIGSTINQIFSKSGSQFFRLKEVDLQSFELPFFPVLSQINALIQNLRRHQLLLLGGTHEDKQEIAIHMAARLKQELEAQSSVSNISILKWNSVSDHKNILEKIRGDGYDRTDFPENSIRIIILPDFKPDYVAFDITKIEQALQGCQCYVIADTNNPLQDWAMTERQQQEIWWDTAQVSYELSSLAEAAVRRLSEAEINLNTLESDLRQRIIALKTVSRVKDCIQWLKNEKQPLTQEALDRALSKANQDRSATLKRWFGKELTYREQLLAIGVSLFRNLFSNQFFAALERVAEKTWHKREPSLSSLDYSDLSFLGNYCEFLSGSYRYTSGIFTHIDTEQQATEFEISQLKLRRPDEARFLLEVAWKAYQRQIIKALKEMAQMVEDSLGRVERTSSDWELFGDEFQSQQLRAVIGQTLGEIGLVSLSATNAVQNVLLSLAANNSIGVRDVAAKAIASWYPDERQKFYETLQRLYSTAVGKDLNSAEQRAADYIGATVAMTVSYAALSDSPNHLSEELVSWMNELSESKSLVVRGHLGYHTLALVVPRHFEQLKVFIKRLIEKHGELSEDGDGLADAIGCSLAQTYQQYPEETLGFIEEGFQYWQTIIRNLKQKELIQVRKTKSNWANVIIITIHKICLSGKIDSKLSSCIFNYLIKLLRGRNKIISQIALEVLCQQVKENFLVISDNLKEGAVMFRQEERTSITEALTAVYLQQRQALDAPDCEDTWYAKNGNLYRIWIENDRPLTAIEETLYSWLGDTKFITAEQLATQAFVSFAKEFDMEEASFLINFNFLGKFKGENELRISSYSSQDYFRAPTSVDSLSKFWAWLAILPTALPEMLRNRIWKPYIVQQYQPVVSNILPQAVIQAKENDRAVQFVVNKWKTSQEKRLGQVQDAPELTRLAKFLSPSLWLAKNPEAFFLIFLLSVSVSLWIVYSAVGGIMGSIGQNIDSSAPAPAPNRYTPTPTPTPTRTPNRYTPTRNVFESETFPKQVCGDPLPENPRVYPVSFYPVFINYTKANLRRVSTHFCRDARKITRQKSNKTSIQVASFISSGRAEEFRAFLASRFGSAEVGEPTIIREPATKSNEQF